MTAETLHAILGDLDDNFIAEAEAFRVKRPNTVRRALVSAAALAACCCLIVTAGSLLMAGQGANSAAPESAPNGQFAEAADSDKGLLDWLLPGSSGSDEAGTADDALYPPGTPPVSGSTDAAAGDRNDGMIPTIQWEGRNYLGIVPTRELIFPTLPEGCVYQGESPSGPWYANPDDTLYIYVYQEGFVRWDEESGTWKDSANPTRAYCAYTVEWLQSTRLVSVDDELYCRIFGAEYEDGFDRVMDVDQYLDLVGQHGNTYRESALPSGFILLGNAEECTKNTIPQGALTANFADATVYSNPAIPQLLLVETSRIDSQGQTHIGYDAYLRFEPHLD